MEFCVDFFDTIEETALRLKYDTFTIQYFPFLS